MRKNGQMMADVRVTVTLSADDLASLLVSSQKYGGPLLPKSTTDAKRLIRKELASAIDNLLCGSCDGATDAEIETVKGWVAENFPEFG